MISTTRSCAQIFCALRGTELPSWLEQTAATCPPLVRSSTGRSSNPRTRGTGGGGDAEEGQEEDAGEDEEGGDTGEEDDEDDGPEGRADDEDEGDIEGSADSGEDEDEGDDAAEDEDDRGGEPGRQRNRQQGLSRVGSALRGSASAAREGYERGKQFAAESWQSHPLFIGGAALAAGAAVAMLLPPSSLEDTLMGKAADRVNDRLRQATGGLLGQGKGVLSRALTEAADTAAREAEREGLTPERLGRKVKRVVGQIRQAVAETVE